ncbi:hypothetical protein DFH09DRAFT_1300265 [Mycena vulgaris]|nr:hypothetical protein DFH09DRAFT_1300265 [Mycena vulgaris]
MDCIASSQPWQDGEGDISGLDMYFSGKTSPLLSDFDVVGTSQPWEDGEDDLPSYYGLKVPTGRCESPTPPIPASRARSRGLGIVEPLTLADTDTTALDTPPRRRHLIRRAPPCSPPRPPVMRPRGHLVRRVTMGPDIERRRKRACKKARSIVKKIRVLSKATERLRRKHRALCAFVREPFVRVPQPSKSNKENVFSILV